jgi:hypothetical protein
MLFLSLLLLAVALRPVISLSAPHPQLKRLDDANTTFPDLYEATIADLQAGLDAGHFTSVDLVTVRTSAPTLILRIMPPHRLTLPE